MRRLEFENDTFAFGDKLVRKWFPGAKGDKAGILLVVSAGKDGALTGGSAFMKVRRVGGGVGVCGVLGGWNWGGGCWRWRHAQAARLPGRGRQRPPLRRRHLSAIAPPHRHLARGPTHPTPPGRLWATT